MGEADVVAALLDRTVVQPCVEHLRSRYAAVLRGVVLVGPHPDPLSAHSTRIVEGLDETDPALVWGRLDLPDEDESFEGPLAHPRMAHDELAQTVGVWLGNGDDWFCETRVGWGEEEALPAVGVDARDWIRLWRGRSADAHRRVHG